MRKRAVPTLDELAVTIRSDGATPLDRLVKAEEVARDLTTLGGELIRHFAAEARADCSWEEIGRRFGVTKQAAQQRFGGTAPKQVAKR